MDENKTPRKRASKRAKKPVSAKLPEPEVPTQTVEAREWDPQNISEEIVKHLTTIRWPISF